MKAQTNISLKMALITFLICLKTHQPSLLHVAVRPYRGRFLIKYHKNRELPPLE
jgi:hypothetical protein